MLRTQHISAIIAVCINCSLLHNKLPQSLADKIHKHLSSHIASDQESRSSLAGWLWLRVTHEAAVIWQLAWSWKRSFKIFAHRVLGRKPQFLIVWISLQGCLRVLTLWLPAFSGASEPRERKRMQCFSWPSLRSPTHHQLYPNLFLKGESSSLLSLKEKEIESTFWTGSKSLWKRNSDAEGPPGAGQAERVLSLDSGDSFSTMV